LTFSQLYTGRTGYAAGYVEGTYQLSVAVECLVGEFSVNALLDTGSHWCVLPAQIAIALDEATAAEGLVERMSTRLGTFPGRLARIPLILVAEEGESLDVEATWFVSGDWPGPAVIGWKGCLERIRFALDPTLDLFYFAEAY
jgi:hypothetical protein